MKMLSVLMLLIVFPSAFCNLQVKDNWEIGFQHGLEEYMKTGEKSSELDNALSGLEFPQIFRKKLANVERKLVNSVICEACRIGLGVVISSYRIGVPKKIVIKTIVSLCIWFKIEHEEVCQGLIDSNIDIIAYIIDNRPQLNSHKVCSMLLQDYQCQDLSRVNWTIDIPHRNFNNSSISNAQKLKKKEPLKILHLTDFHYDPYYTVNSNANCEFPLCCQPGTKPKTPQDAAGYWGDYRYCNTPWHTVVNLFDHILNQHKTISYVYFTGDIIRHKVWDTNVTSNSEAITEIFLKFNETFDSIPVYPILGNHEPHPLNQFSSEDINSHELSTKWVFDLVAVLWKPWLSSEAIKTVRRGGYYTVLVKPGFRLIALNSNVCYTFNWWLLYDDEDPFGQLQWLVDTLLDAETHNEKVHILSHVPTSESFCLENWGWEYSKIIDRFSHVITAQFNGHTHEDDTTIFFSLNNSQEAINVAFNGGSFSTYNDLNPNYKVFDVDSQTLFVAHSNVQQLLASIWYEGLPGFRRKNMVLQALEIVRIGILFPFFSAAYVLAPHSVIGKTMRKPFIKFICNSASYFAFLFMLILASQRIETLFFDEEPEDVPTKRGAKPSLVEWIILAWVCGLIWSEIKQLWDVGLEEYARDMWNVIDFITNSLYVATVALRVVSYYQVQRNPKSEMIKREDWDAWDPMLISEGLFSAANIFSSLKLVYIFSVNPHLGPLQVSLSRMVMDIMKFFFLYVLVLFAFSCGLNQLLWYYADAERLKCPSEYSKPVCAEIILDQKLPNHTKLTNCTVSDTVADSNACTIWRRFANLFETSQTLFWAVFGLVDLESFELSGIKIFTRFWGMLMFGTYSVINIVVLLNLLIAMMNHSYQLISERADVEWKFARSKLWISYFEEGGTVPPPFNIIPTPKSVWYVIEWVRRKLCGHSKAAKKEHMRTIRRKVKQASERDFRYQSIMRNLVRRYVTVEQRKAENQGVTEDDVNEIKQDISAFRFELIEILKNSGMNTSTAQSGMGSGAGGKKNRQKERRLMKGFNIGPQPSTTTAPLPPVAEFIASLQHHHEGQQHDLFGSTLSGIFNSTPRKIHQQSTVSSSQGSINEGSYHHHHHHHHRGLTKYENWFHVKRGSAHKRRWGTLIEAAKSGKVSRLIGRSRSEDSVCNSTCRENGHNHSHSHSNSPASDENGSVSATDSNPSLDIVPPELSRPHEEHHHGLTSGLLLLKKKRKKFSASRNAIPIVQPHNAIEHPLPVTSGKSNKKILQRASSVPVRVSEIIPPAKRNLEQTQSEQESVDILTAIPTLTPSTTEESVAAAGQSALPTGTSSREPLLYNSSSSTQATGSSQTPEDEYKHNGQYYNPKLPGVIPISGHNGPTGWL